MPANSRWDLIRGLFGLPIFIVLFFFRALHFSVLAVAISSSRRQVVTHCQKFCNSHRLFWCKTLMEVNVSAPLVTSFILLATTLTYLKTASIILQTGRVQVKCDGTRWRTGGEVKGKLANRVGRQYSSHHLGTWCFQHYYRWCAHLGCQ